MFKHTATAALAARSALQATRPFSVTRRTLNDLDDLIKTPTQRLGRRNVDAVFDIDELLANSPALKDGAGKRYDDFSFGASAVDPREVAKAVNVTGPLAGRTVDVKFNNIGLALGSMYSVLRTNGIKSKWHEQKRHIRPAKLQKEKHRAWWRKQFKKGFSDLMSQISDAKRRGY